MRTVIVFNHPYEGSYCNAILKSVMNGLHKADQDVDLIHLDNDRFDPVMTKEDLKAFLDRKPVDPVVLNYTERLARADHLIFIFPIWWEMMPALTKGFIDRVIFPGVAFEFKEKGHGMNPLLKNLKGVTVITTMNTPRLLYRLRYGNAVKKALLTGTFFKLGYRNLKWINLSMVKSASDKKRRKWLNDIEAQFASPN